MATMDDGRESDHESENDNERAEHALTNDPTWRAALAKAVTPEAMEEARTFARMLLLHGADAYCDETPAELAHEAMAETALGRGRWDPARGALGAFLCGRVRYLLGVRARAAARTVRLDLVEDDHPQAAELELALSHAPGTAQHLATRAQAAAVVQLLRDLCADDREALAYLDARLAGHERQADIATAMGTAITAARAAHRRVVRCCTAAALVTPADAARCIQDALIDYLSPTDNLVRATSALEGCPALHLNIRTTPVVATSNDDVPF